jgi:acetyl esterase/lipase
MSCRSIINLAVFVTTLSFGTSLPAAELPPEAPLWEKESPELAVRADVKEQVRSLEPQAGSPSGLNRVFSSVSLPTYTIHRPRKPKGVGLVICPGGGFRDVWLDREGHDLAIWLKDHNVTSLVLKYRTFVASDKSPANTWSNALRAADADARQAVRVLRKQASALRLDPNKIGICGFSAGGQLALKCALSAGPKPPEGEVSAMPDFAGLFYPGIPDEVAQVMANRTASGPAAAGLCPFFIINACDDKLTPADKCVDFYRMLLRAGVKAELHVFSKGSHGFDLGTGRGESVAIWPASFVAWLRDSIVIQASDARKKMQEE